MSATPLMTLRAFLFNILFYVWTAIISLAGAPGLIFLDDRYGRAVARVWMRVTNFLLRWVVGLTYEVRGREHLPKGAAIIASKHQSAWETMIFNLLVPDLVVGLKEELARIPVFGWYVNGCGFVKIDRGGAAKALRSLIVGAKERMSRGCTLLLFPEGTRRAPGAPPDYKPGVVAVYAALGVPVVPVALNSGLFWGRRSFIKRPGVMTMEILEPIPPGLDRRVFLQTLEERTETATARLVAEGRRQLGESAPPHAAGQPRTEPL